MDKQQIDELKAQERAATPGPWMWDMRTGCKLAQIVTTHSGMYYVMQFARWGMSDACPVFQVYEKYDGPVDERRGRGMVRADNLAKSYPGKEHHQGFDDYIDHPDAIIMVAARNALPELLEEIERLQDALATETKRVDEMTRKYDEEHRQRVEWTVAINKARGELEDENARLKARAEAYSASGLTPEECAELAAAKREGRLTIRKHECEDYTVKPIKMFYRRSGIDGSESLGVYQCECGKLWKIRSQCDGATGNDDIWLSVGESARGYEFTLAEAEAVLAGLEGKT